MRMRRWATMRKPASSITALILPVRLRLVASGLMIEKVRSVMRVFGSLNWGEGRDAPRGGGLYSRPTGARQGAALQQSSQKARAIGMTWAQRSAMDPPGQ